jgi:tellurite resistance protein
MIYLSIALAYVASLAFAGWMLYLRAAVSGDQFARWREAIEARLHDLANLSAQTDAKINRFAASAKSLADTTETVSLLALRAGLRGQEKPRV